MVPPSNTRTKQLSFESRIDNDHTNHNRLWFVYRELGSWVLTGFIGELYTDFVAPVNFEPPGPALRNTPPHERQAQPDEAGRGDGLAPGANGVATRMEGG